MKPAAVRHVSQNEIALIADEAKTIEYIDLETGVRRSVALGPGGQTLTTGAPMMDLPHDPETDSTLRAVAGGSEGITHWRDDTRAGRAPVFARPLDLNSLGPRVDGRKRVRANAAELGVGVGSRVSGWGEGHFVLLPWSATIVRLTPGVTEARRHHGSAKGAIRCKPSAARSIPSLG